jgi:hypothetical protein
MEHFRVSICRSSTVNDRHIRNCKSSLSLYLVRLHECPIYQDMTLLHTITHPSRLHDIHFCKRVSDSGELLLVAAEDKKLSIYDVTLNTEDVPFIVAEMIGHSNRFAYFPVCFILHLLKSFPSASKPWRHTPSLFQLHRILLRQK